MHSRTQKGEQQLHSESSHIALDVQQKEVVPESRSHQEALSILHDTKSM